MGPLKALGADAGWGPDTQRIIPAGSGVGGYFGRTAHLVIGFDFLNADPWFCLERRPEELLCAQDLAREHRQGLLGSCTMPILGWGWGSGWTMRMEPSHPCPPGAHTQKEKIIPSRAILALNKFGVKLEKGDKTIVTNK